MIGVDFIDKMGDDAAVCDAARVSFAKEASQFTDEQNDKLLVYLARHNHWSPFAHVVVKLRIRAPIFIARQLQKHQIGFAWNETSRRYVDNPPELFHPASWRGRPESVKQGSGGDIPKQSIANDVLDDAYSAAVTGYDSLLALGVAPEQARMVLPQGMMTEWVWSGSVAAWARVCKQRLDPHAQAEAAVVARLISDIVGPLFPVSWMALIK